MKELQLFVEQYDILKPEIEDGQDNEIKFKNGSYIKVIKPEEQSSKGKRASFDHWMFDFEGCMLSKEQIDKVLNQFRKRQDICDCLEHNSKGEEICFGTKEREYCSCDGDKIKCNFYKKQT